MKENRKLKGVCVGAGYFSRFQYEAWERISEVEIVANCNRSLQRAQDYATEFGIERTYAYDDFAVMLDEMKPDFVDIITPPETHLELCHSALAKDIAVICQKPLAPTHGETLEIARIVKDSRARFMVHENWRWQPWYREIKSLINDGVIGDPFHLSFQCRIGDGWGQDAYLDRQPFFRDYPRLFIFETGVHFLDTFRFLLGEVESVYARTAKRNPVIKGEDSALLVCSFAKGVTAVLDANRYNETSADNPRYTFGTLRLDGSAGHLELADDGSITIKRLGEDSRKHEYSPATAGFAGDCVHAVQRHFIDAFLANSLFESELEDYLKSVQLVEMAYQSASSHQAVETAGFQPPSDS